MDGLIGGEDASFKYRLRCGCTAVDGALHTLSAPLPRESALAHACILGRDGSRDRGVDFLLRGWMLVVETRSLKRAEFPVGGRSKKASKMVSQGVRITEGIGLSSAGLLDTQVQRARS
jgi:hypothetical protein